MQLASGGYVLFPNNLVSKRVFPALVIRGTYTMLNIDPEPGILKTFTRVYVRGAEVNPSGMIGFPMPSRWKLDLRVDNVTWLTFAPNVDYHNGDYYMEFLVDNLIGYTLDIRVRYEVDLSQEGYYGVLTPPILIDYEPSGARNWG